MDGFSDPGSAVRIDPTFFGFKSPSSLIEGSNPNDNDKDRDGNGSTRSYPRWNALDWVTQLRMHRPYWPDWGFPLPLESLGKDKGSIPSTSSHPFCLAPLFGYCPIPIMGMRISGGRGMTDPILSNRSIHSFSGNARPGPSLFMYLLGGSIRRLVDKGGSCPPTSS